MRLFVKTISKKKLLFLILFILVFMILIIKFIFTDNHKLLIPTHPELRAYTNNKFEPVEGSYLGGYIIQDKNVNTPKEFNQLTKKNHASFFRYLGYGQAFPRFWVQELKEVGAVPQIALEPNAGLDQIQDDEYLRNFAKAANEANVPIFLRFASEMNGDWTAYSDNPKKYKEKWRLVHNIMEEEAPNVAMVWTVFVHESNRSFLKRTWDFINCRSIMNYYPGDDYVDWVGVNVYSVRFLNANLDTPSSVQSPLRLIEYVYNEFSTRKPIYIAEWGVPHYTIADNSYNIDFATTIIKEMYQGLENSKKRVKAVYYFNVNALENAESAPKNRQTRNYSLTDNEKVLNQYQEVISSDYYKENIYNNTVNILVDEKEIDTQKNVIIIRDEVYLPFKEVLNVKGLELIYNENNLEINGLNYSVIIFINDLYYLKNGIKKTITNEIFLFQDTIYIKIELLNNLLDDCKIELADDYLYFGEKPLKGIVFGGQRINIPYYFTIHGKYALYLADILRQKDYTFQWISEENKLMILTEENQIFIYANEDYGIVNDQIIPLQERILLYKDHLYITTDDLGTLFSTKVELLF